MSRPCRAPPEKGSSETRARAAGVGGLPVDRGWAWVIVAASCGIFGLPAGSGRVYGIMYLEMIDHFQCDQQLTLWLFSIRGLVTLLSGPMVSLILHRTSYRTVTCLGGALTASSMIASAFVPVMEVCFFTVGLVYAFGKSCLHIAGLTCTVPYFEKHKGLAVGLTAAGGGVMAFVMPHVTRALFDTFSYTGAMILHGGIFLHIFIFALLLRPLSLYMPRKSNAKIDRSAPVADGAAAEATATAAFKSSGSTINSEQFAIVSSNQVSVSDFDLASNVHLPNDNRDESLEVKVATASIQSGGSDARSPCDISLLRNERMWMICIIMLFASNAFSIVYTAIPPYGDSIGLPRSTVSQLLAVGGAFEIVCRGLHGWLSDRKIIPSLLQLGLCSGITGVAALLCTVAGGEAGVGILCAACGVAGTSIFTLVTVSIRDLLGTERMTSAMGIQMASQGVSFILSTYMTGYLTELSGSWLPVFYYISGNLIVASLLSIGYCLRLRLVCQKAAGINIKT